MTQVLSVLPCGIGRFEDLDLALSEDLDLTLSEDLDL